MRGVLPLIILRYGFLIVKKNLLAAVMLPQEMLCTYRGKTAVYWATLSHSKDVLEVLCTLAQQEGCNLDVSIPDHSNSTPLDVAVASQQWDMVKLLVQNGGLKVRLCGL
jgi:hypothetical protein